MFKLEKPNYDIQQIGFNVDDKFNEIIKEPFPNHSFFMTVLGPPKSGKTNLLINMITNKKIYKKVFDKIILVMPTTSMKSIKNNIFSDLPADQHFNELSPDVFIKIKSLRDEFDKIEELEKEKKKKPKTRRMLVIFDDVLSQLKNPENYNLLVSLATRYRHLRVSVILLAQYLRNIPKPVRSQISHLVAFKMPNELDKKILREEYIGLKLNEFIELVNFVYQNPHDFLFIDLYNNGFYKNLSKIIMRS